MPTPKPSQETRISLGDIKLQIAKRIGPERSRRYFCYVNLLLTQKLRKSDFNKYCIPIIGRENIPLHNHFICSIYKNAFLGKTPPPFVHEKVAFKPPEVVGKNLSQEGSMVNQLEAPSLKHTVWSNGNSLPSSPRKVRSCIRERSIKDRPSSLGQNGRMDMSFQQSTVLLDDNVLRENGIHDTCHLKRQMQHHQGDPLEHLAKKSRIGNLVPQGRTSADGQGLLGFVVMENEDELQQADNLNSNSGPLQAPLGIPFCPASTGGARRSSYLAASSSGDILSSNHYCGELCDTEALKRRMEKAAEVNGLEGITLDCANLLNNGLDAYLKRLIKSCVESSGQRAGHDQTKHPVLRQQAQAKPINGLWPQEHMHGQSCVGSSNNMPRLKTCSQISLQAFRVAMELNPQQLGEDWPLLLEKISLLSYDE
ncbi:hypothetical protein Cni_G22247 [Canna indica]|uniref:Uncharacterized protein n=1 Tax=Canna indica TaxID=4628 RepID=A0AAQ3KTY0_9LILI|nr:hypothetical protein Cni_G22247 [Canna indica]